MNKTLALLALFIMGAFSSVQADETESAATDTASVSQETVVTEKPVEEKEKDCGCKH